MPLLGVQAKHSAFDHLLDDDIRSLQGLAQPRPCVQRLLDEASARLGDGSPRPAGASGGGGAGMASAGRRFGHGRLHQRRLRNIARHVSSSSQAEASPSPSFLCTVTEPAGIRRYAYPLTLRLPAPPDGHWPRVIDIETGCDSLSLKTHFKGSIQGD